MRSARQSSRCAARHGAPHPHAADASLANPWVEACRVEACNRRRLFNRIAQAGAGALQEGGGGRLHRFIIARVFVALQEEMQRGYFDDFRDFRDSQGKVFAAPQRLVAASNVRAAEGQEG